MTNAGVTVGGSGGGARTLTITPIANAFGTTTITVRVEDEAGLTTQQTFVVTVTAVNDVPAITAIPNQAVAEDAPALVLAVRGERRRVAGWRADAVVELEFDECGALAGWKCDVRRIGRVAHGRRSRRPRRRAARRR